MRPWLGQSWPNQGGETPHPSTTLRAMSAVSPWYATAEHSPSSCLLVDSGPSCVKSRGFHTAQRLLPTVEGQLLNHLCLACRQKIQLGGEPLTEGQRDHGASCFLAVVKKPGRLTRRGASLQRTSCPSKPSCPHFRQALLPGQVPHGQALGGEAHRKAGRRSSAQPRRSRAKPGPCQGVASRQ